MTRQTLTIACWNILYDEANHYGVADQADRLADITQTLTTLPRRPDIVGLVEVQESESHGNHGQIIAHKLSGQPGHWVGNNRAGEMIGIFGSAANNLTAIDIGDRRVAGVFETAGVRCALVHLTFKLRGELIRTKQLKVVLDALGAEGPAIIFGDFNSASMQRSRRLLSARGFCSVFAGTKHARTSVSDEYLRKLPKPWQIVLRRGFRADDIYVRGLVAQDAGIFVGNSDHHGVWATIEVDI